MKSDPFVGHLGPAALLPNGLLPEPRGVFGNNESDLGADSSKHAEAESEPLSIGGNSGMELGTKSRIAASLQRRPPG